MPQGPPNRPATRATLRSLLREFLDGARETPRSVRLTLLATPVLCTLSHYLGSRRAFHAWVPESLFSDPLLPLYGYLYWFGSAFVVYFLIPLGLIAVLHRAPYREFGLGTGDVRTGLRLLLLFTAIMLPVVWIASDAPAFQSVYPHAQLVKGDWSLFLLYEAGLLVYFTGWEFIWRGYVLFGLRHAIGTGAAVLVQTLPFVLLHNGKPLPETLGAIVAGIALGALALRTRSVWYGVIVHWIVMFSIDLFSTLRFRSGASGWGMDAVRLIMSTF